jgi:hypothetical protein
MLDQIFNPSPTLYKWDRFWVGFLPALALPVLSLFALYGITWLNARYGSHEELSLPMFWISIQSQNVFLKSSTICCMPNALIFFFLIQRNYNNASRAVVITSMLWVLAIVIKTMM